MPLNPFSTIRKKIAASSNAQEDETPLLTPEERALAEAGVEDTAINSANKRPSALSRLALSFGQAVNTASSSLATTKKLERAPLGGDLPDSTISDFNLACKTGDMENFNRIIAQQPNIIKQPFNGVHPLLTALNNNRSEIATALIEKGANPDPNYNGAPLLMACNNGDEKTVKALIDKNVNLNISRETGVDAILLACKKNHPKIVEQLIKAGLVPRETILHLACGLGHLEVAKVLIEKKPELLNQADDIGETPFFKVCKNGHKDVALLLLQAKADVNKVNKFGTTLLYSACDADKPDIAALLIDHGAKIQTNTIGGGTLLHSASDEGYTKVAKVLIEKTTLLNEIDHKGETAIFKASKKGNAETVELLIEAKADVKKAAKDGRTPIDIACLTCKLEIVQMLFEAGANVGTKTIDQIKNDSENIDLLPERIEMQKLIKKITTKESIEERDKKLEKRNQPSRDVNSAGAGLVADQKTGTKSSR
jgi:ankyrin repeat protein